MNAFKLTTSIPEDRKLHLDVPSTIPIGPVEIIMIYPDSESITGRGMQSHIESLRMSSHKRRSKKSIDGELAAERNSWD